VGQVNRENLIWWAKRDFESSSEDIKKMGRLYGLRLLQDTENDT
jgi:hypothetical protein